MEDIILNTEGYLRYFHVNDANRKGSGSVDADFIPVTRALKKINFLRIRLVEVDDLSIDPYLTRQSTPSFQISTKGSQGKKRRW